MFVFSDLPFHLGTLEHESWQHNGRAEWNLEVFVYVFWVKACAVVNDTYLTIFAFFDDGYTTLEAFR